MADTRQHSGLLTKLVDNMSTIPNRIDVKTGTASNSESTEIKFDDGSGNDIVAVTVDVMAIDNGLSVRFIAEDGTGTDQIYVPKNSTRSFAFRARGFTVQNKVSGSTADYELVAQYVSA